MAFHLRFNASEVPFWAERYVTVSEAADPQWEAEIERRFAPAAKARRYLKRREFQAICCWKSPRPKQLYAENSDGFVEAVTLTALSTPSEQLRIQVLTLLSGVGWPVASAILHWTHRKSYPILDFRALWSLGWSQNPDKPGFIYDFDDWPPAEERSPFVYDLDHWWAYTLYCRRLRQEAGVAMRDLDRALWQYARENMPRTLRGITSK